MGEGILSAVLGFKKKTTVVQKEHLPELPNYMFGLDKEVLLEFAKRWNEVAQESSIRIYNKKKQNEENHIS